MIVGYIIEIAKLVDNEWFKKEVRFDTIEQLRDYLAENTKLYTARLRVLRKVEK